MPIQDAPTRPRGQVETIAPAPWLVDPIEHVPDLVFPASVYTYAKMRRDPTIRSVLNAYTLPILRAPWHVDARGASDTITRVVADSLGLPVLGDPDPVEGPVATRWVRWTDHLRLALRDLVYGFMPFEPVYNTDTGTAYLAGLPERMPWSITELVVDAAGGLAGVKQAREGKRDLLIPADLLLFYVHDREGASWAGTSLLRETFAPWLFKTDALRGQARTLRRYGTPVPVMEPVPGFNPTPAQNLEAQRLGAAFRGDADGAAATTPGYRLRLVGVEGAAPDHLPFLRYLDEQIARASMTSVLDLGNTDNGSRALGSVFLDLLIQAMQATAEEHATIASTLARRLTDFNEGPDAEAPLIVVGDVGSSRQVLAQTVASLVQAGALVVDTALEGWVRDAFDLPASTGTPPAATPAPTPPPGPPDQPAPDQPAPGQAGESPPLAAADGSPRSSAVGTQTGWPYRRPLTSIEAAAGVNPVALDTALQLIVSRFLQDWGETRKDQVDAILEAVGGAVEVGQLEALASYVAPYQDTADALAAAMTAGWEAGVASAVAEVTAQRKTPKPPQTGPPESRYRDSGATGAASLASSLTTGAMREAMRLAGPNTPPGVVVAGVDAYLAGLSGALPSDVATGLVGAGINDGRAAVAVAVAEGDGDTPGLSARYFASEVRDANTCPACADLDGTEFASLQDAEAAYPTGGYTDCQGGLRCRGIIFAVYGDDPLPDEGTTP